MDPMAIAIIVVGLLLCIFCCLCKRKVRPQSTIEHHERGVYVDQQSSYIEVNGQRIPLQNQQRVTIKR